MPAVQIVHRDRTMYNARNGEDIAMFLADSSKEDIEQHLDNLRSVAIENTLRSLDGDSLIMYGQSMFSC